MNDKILIVEGFNDESFFSKFCVYHGYDVSVKIKVNKPSSLSAIALDNKQGVLALVQIYIKLLDNGGVEKLGIIVDSDYANTGGGVTRTLDQIHGKIREYGYSDKPKQLPDTSYYFERDDKVTGLHVWIMPDNLSEGYLEHWITSNINDVEREYFNKIDSLIDGFSEKKIKQIQMAKAKVQVWLACQDKPSQDMRGIIQSKYLDETKTNYLNFKSWMENTFR